MGDRVEDPPLNLLPEATSSLGLREGPAVVAKHD